MTIKYIILINMLLTAFCIGNAATENRPKVIVTTDAEIDDECSMVRFLLYANDFDIKGIVTSSSQYHYHGHKWAGDDWMEPYLAAYEKVYPNLCLHDNRYPSPEYVRSVTKLGNVKAEGEMDEITPGSELIVDVLLDTSDNSPVWIQAWGGSNTLARALKTIEEKYPEKMAYVANKMRLFLIWEQDESYQNYIRKIWGKYNILTIISDQFITYFYHWKKYLPDYEQSYLNGKWMKENILTGHGALCSMYRAHDNGDFRSEGDSPAYFHIIPNGLNNPVFPDWGGWGGRYIKVRENTYLDSVPEKGYVYPEGRWYTSNAWGRTRLKKEIQNDSLLVEYLKPSWIWIAPLQNDFASRADWCVKTYSDANHPPVVKLGHSQYLNAWTGKKIKVKVIAEDPDKDQLNYKWWHYADAGTKELKVKINNADKPNASIIIPENAKSGDVIHLICEVSDNGSPSLTRYGRAIVTIK